MKKVLGLMVAVTLLAWTIGCASSKQIGPLNGGNGGGGSSATISSGNWSFITNGGTNGPLFMGGYLTASGSSIAGNLVVVGSQGSGFTITSASSPMSVTGSAANGTITFTGVIASSTITVTFTNQTGTGLTSLTDNGTYTVVGGTDAGDSGTVTGAIASDFSGTWQGTEPVTSGVMSVAFTESVTPNPAPNRAGTFQLTSVGTGVTFSGVTGCAVTGTLDSTLSFTAGNIVYLKINTTDQGVPGQLIYLGFADNVTTPSQLSGGGYIYGGGSGCMLQNDSTQHALTLSKQ